MEPEIFDRMSSERIVGIKVRELQLVYPVCAYIDDQPVSFRAEAFKVVGGNPFAEYNCIAFGFRRQIIDSVGPVADVELINIVSVAAHEGVVSAPPSECRCRRHHEGVIACAAREDVSAAP